MRLLRVLPRVTQIRYSHSNVLRESNHDNGHSRTADSACQPLADESLDES
jgi:hypothetical protein